MACRRLSSALVRGGTVPPLVVTAAGNRQQVTHERNRMLAFVASDQGVLHFDCLAAKYAFEDEAVIIPGEGMRFQPRYFSGAFNLHQRAYALMGHSGDARFVYYAIDRYKDVLARMAVQSTVLSLRLPIIEAFPVSVP